MVDWDKIRHFKKEEWGEWEKVDPELIYKMDELRERAGFPIIIHEAFATSGHASNSFHYRGQAVDFHFSTLPGRGSSRLILPYRKQFGYIIGANFFGVGFYHQWKNKGWHVDLRPYSRAQFWNRNNGRYYYFIR